MANKIFKKGVLLALTLALCLAFSAYTAPADAAIPCFDGIGALRGFPTFSGGGCLPTASHSGRQLYVGGMPFGVKFLTDGVVVTGTYEIESESGKTDPMALAGLKPNDVILSVNGVRLTDAASLSRLAEESGGSALSIIYERGGEQKKCTLQPVKSREDGKYKTGAYVRDSGAGIGTVTYIEPETLSFGGLGHGICDAETGRLIPMQRGSVLDVTINGVVKGAVGAPGEVRGYFSSGKTGTLLQNTECGVFGALAALPEGASLSLMPVGGRSEIKNGEAYILSTLEGSAPQKYSVEISDIRRTSTSNKCFTVKVTDPSLLEKSGGIVQGMSGSPIIQNGKLVGAVTHVLINDPTTGYGIFIENMLNAAETPMQKAA